MGRMEYDINLRSLVDEYSHDFLHWLVDDSARVEEIINTVLPSRERRADFAMRYSDSSGESQILHLEFQRKAIPEMPMRMAEYALSILLNYGQAPTQFLILLDSTKAAQQMPDTFSGGSIRVQYQVIRLWQSDPQPILQSGRAGLIPLVPLMGEPDALGERLVACEAAITKQVELESRQQDLMATAVLLSSLQPNARNVIEEFIRSRRMVDLMESPLLKDWLHEAEAKGEAIGEAKGEVEGRREMLIRLLSRKFGDLPESVLAKLQKFSTPEQLENLLDIAVDSTSLSEFQNQLK